MIGNEGSSGGGWWDRKEKVEMVEKDETEVAERDEKGIEGYSEKGGKSKRF